MKTDLSGLGSAIVVASVNWVRLELGRKSLGNRTDREVCADYPMGVLHEEWLGICGREPWMAALPTRVVRYDGYDYSTDCRGEMSTEDE